MLTKRQEMDKERETTDAQLQTLRNVFTPEWPLSACHNNSLSFAGAADAGELDGAWTPEQHLHHQSDHRECAVTGKCSAISERWRTEDGCYFVPSNYVYIWETVS